MSQLIERDLNSISGEMAHAGWVHPDDILAAPDLTTAEKRAILASCASDKHAVIGDPTCRQLPGGAVVTLREITRALEALDWPAQSRRDDWRYYMHGARSDDALSPGDSLGAGHPAATMIRRYLGRKARERCDYSYRDGLPSMASQEIISAHA